MSEKYGVSEFEPSEVQISTEATERDLLDKEKRRIERAITRLSSSICMRTIQCRKRSILSSGRN